ncbi:MAG: LTA synthase family protein [Luteimonas sp.]
MRRPAALSPLSRAVAVLLAATAFALMAWWLDRRMLGVAPEAYLAFRPVFANALPGLLGALALTALTRRPLFSLLVIAGAQALVYRIGTLKLQVLADPLGLQDLYFVTNLTPDSFALLGAYVEHPWTLFAGVVLLGAIAGLAWWLERPAFRAWRWTHAILAVAAVGLCGTLVAARQPWTALYSQDTLRPSRFEAMAGILHAGQMSNLVYSHLRNRHSLDTLDEAALKELLDTVPIRVPAVAADAVRPDIVVILSESLFDARRMKGMDALPDPVPNVRAELAAGHGGEMQVPTFGGGTVRTEFEVLTGMPMDAFPDARFPYVSLVRDHIPSLVGQVEAHGYRTVAIHGNSGSFWNRQNAYRALGFDRFLTKDDFPANAQRDGRYYSDAATTDMILRELDQAAKTAPTLVVAISIEAHGPYRHPDEADAPERDAIPVPAGLPAEQAAELRDYLHHAHHADAQLGRLLQALAKRARPTVVLFFGDHLPALGSTYDRLGFVDGKPARQQPVPWVLLRSDRPGARVDAPAGMASWMLPAEVLRLAGLADDPWFALTDTVARRMDSAPRPRQRRLARGLDAAAVARLNGSFESRLRAHGAGAGAGEKAR